MRAKVNRVLVVMFAALSLAIAVSPIAVEGTTGLAKMPAASQLCIADGGGSGGG
jgi:hypothetical protein